MKKVFSWVWIPGLTLLYALGWLYFGITHAPEALYLVSMLNIPLLLYGFLAYRDLKRQSSACAKLLESLSHAFRLTKESLYRYRTEQETSGTVRSYLSVSLPQVEGIFEELSRQCSSTPEAHNSIHQIDRLVEAISRMPEHLLKAFQTVFAESDSTAKQLKAHREQKEEWEKILQDLCAIHVPLQVSQEWKSVIEGEWEKLSIDTLESLSKIKEMQNSSSQFIEEVMKQFQIHHNSYETYTETYQSSLEQYFNKVEEIRGSYVHDLDTSSEQIRASFAQFDKIVDITERIKLISLNMSIEASKVKGTTAFGLLARELRRLAEHTESTVKGITEGIQNTLAEVEANKERQMQEFSRMVEIIDHFKGISKKYDTHTEELTNYIHKAIYQIESNQQHEKTILMQFFKNLQQIAIRKEEMHHLFQYLEEYLKRTDSLVQQIVRGNRLCRGVGCPDRKEALDLLASIVSTDGERQMVNRLYRELLGVEREPTHGTADHEKEGVILF